MNDKYEYGLVSVCRTVLKLHYFNTTNLISTLDILAQNGNIDIDTTSILNKLIKEVITWVDQVKEFDDIMKETIRIMGEKETGIITHGHMEVIGRKWKERPDLIPILQAMISTIQEEHNDFSERILEYKTYVEEIFGLLDLLRSWEDLHLNMKQLADKGKGITATELDRHLSHGNQEKIIDIQMCVDSLQAIIERIPQEDAFTYFSIRVERSLLSDIGTSMTAIQACIIGCDHSNAGAVQKMKNTLSEIIPQINEFVLHLEAAGLPPSLGKEASAALPGGGGAAAEAAEAAEADVGANTATSPMRVGQGEKGVEKKGNSNICSSFSLFSQPNSDKEEAEKSDHDPTKDNVPKSGK